LLLLDFSKNTTTDFKTAEQKGSEAGMSEFCLTVLAAIAVAIVFYGAGAFTVLFGDRSF